MEKRHPLLRALTLALPAGLVIGGCVLYALNASRQFPNGEFRDMPSPAALAPAANQVALAHVTTLRLPQSALNLNAGGSVLYAAMTTAGFAAIDIADPYRPAVAGHVTFGGGNGEAAEQEYVLNLARVGDRLVALDRMHGLVVYEAGADPVSPSFQFAKMLPGGPGNQAVDLEHIGDAVYLAAGGAGLLQLPEDFHAETEARPLLERLDYTNDVAALPPGWVVATDGRNAGLQIVRIADGAPPLPVGNVVCWPLFLENVVVIGQHAFVTTRGDNVLLAFNLGRPERPYLSSFFRNPISAIRSVTTWRDRYVIVGNHFGFIEIFDAVDPERPALVALLPIPGILDALYVRDDALYAALRGKNRIEVFRLIDQPAAPAAEAKPRDDT